jgi:hypothetical protein
MARTIFQSFHGPLKWNLAKIEALCKLLSSGVSSSQRVIFSSSFKGRVIAPEESSAFF